MKISQSNYQESCLVNRVPVQGLSLADVDPQPCRKTSSFRHVLRAEEGAVMHPVATPPPFFKTLSLSLPSYLSLHLSLFLSPPIPLFPSLPLAFSLLLVLTLCARLFFTRDVTETFEEV